MAVVTVQVDWRKKNKQVTYFVVAGEVVRMQAVKFLQFHRLLVDIRLFVCRLRKVLALKIFIPLSIV